MIYWGYLFVLMFLLTLERKNRYASRFCRIFIPALFTLFIGLRGKRIGVDTLSYYEHYYFYGKWGDDWMEPGFAWLNQFCFSMGWDANSLFLMTAAITCFFLYLSLERMVPKFYTISAFCLYLFTFTLLINGIRQGVAVAIFLFSYRFIEERRLVRYVVCLFLASLFHASALLLLPLYFLNQYHLSRKLYFFIYFSSFLGIFINFSSYLPQIMLRGRDYSGYVEDIEKVSASSLGFIVVTLLNIIVFYLMLRNKLNERIPLLVNFVFIAFCLKNLSYNIPFVNRVSFYFIWFEYLLYPYLFYSCRFYMFRNKYLTLALICLICAACWINGTFFSQENKQYPYLFYWEKSY